VASRDVKITVGTIARILLWIVYVWVVLNLVLLFLAFWLQLLGANPQAGFTEWVYRSVSRTMAPFRGIFEPIALSDQSVLNTSLLFAMIIYIVVALLLHAGIDWLTDFVTKRRLSLEREIWDDRLETLPASGSNATGPR
jgi:Na+-translocating ferredoxin:NAD+ oxidoreductase RnfA subunit